MWFCSIYPLGSFYLFSSRKISLGPHFSTFQVGQLPPTDYKNAKRTYHVLQITCIPNGPLPTIAPRIRNKVTRQACCNPPSRPLATPAKRQNKPANCHH